MINTDTIDTTLEECQELVEEFISWSIGNMDVLLTIWPLPMVLEHLNYLRDCPWVFQKYLSLPDEVAALKEGVRVTYDNLVWFMETNQERMELMEELSTHDVSDERELYWGD